MNLVCTGCLPGMRIGRTEPELAPVVAGGAAALGADAVKNKVNEILTPKFKLHVKPKEFCDFDKPSPGFVYCYVLPCDDEKGNCERIQSFSEFREQNNTVVTLGMTLDTVNDLHAFCGHNEDVCIEYWGKFKDDKIILRIYKD